MNITQFEQIQDDIKTAVAHGELSEAFELMLQHFKNSSQFDDLVLQSGSYTSLLKQQRIGTIQPNVFSQQYNQLMSGLLGALNSEHKRILRQQTNEPAASRATNALEDDYKLALARVSILWLLQTSADQNNAYTTSELYKWSKLENRKYIAAAIKEMERAEWLQKSKNEKGLVFSLTEKGRRIATKWSSSALFQSKGE